MDIHVVAGWVGDDVVDQRGRRLRAPARVAVRAWRRERDDDWSAHARSTLVDVPPASQLPLLSILSSVGELRLVSPNLLDERSASSRRTKTSMESQSRWRRQRVVDDGGGAAESSPSTTTRLDVFAAVVADGRDKDIGRSNRRTRLPAVQVSTNQMTRPYEASIEVEELEVVRRRRVRVARNRPTVTWVATYGSRRGWIRETSPTGSYQLIRRHALRLGASDRRERDGCGRRE